MTVKVPRLTPGVDIRKFKLDPTDGFLLTRVDGKRGPSELARETGLPDFSVTRALEKLEKLGVVQLVDANAAPAPVAESRPAPVVAFDTGLLAPKYDPAELDQVADLAPEHKKRVLDLFYRLDDLDHYTLLGVTREADKKTIKRSYFELAAVFHPDRYFKKNLGAFKPKMEVLFTRITTAHDTLTNPDARAEYDAYLREVATTRGMEAMFERAIAEALARGPIAPGEAASAVVPEPQAFERPPSAPLQSSAQDLQRRREALARRLKGGTRPSFRPRAPEAPSNPLRIPTPQDAMDALKRRYHERIEGATQAQAQRHIEAANAALAKEDYAAAATSLNIATEFAPNDTALLARAQEVRKKADGILAESYLKQAKYEERQGHWLEAGRSWQKLAKIRNDAESHERAARALLQSAEGDLHQIADHARKAIMLEPQEVTHHVTLVEVYLKAGLLASARRAAETATALDPNHEPLQNVLKRFPK
jgi:curved DNA-binding protein CbpA